MIGRVLSRSSTFAVFVAVVVTLEVTTPQTAFGIGTGWHEIAAMPDPRWFNAAGVGSDGKIYVYGGYVRNDQGSRKYGMDKWSLVVFEPKTNTWTRGPAVGEYRVRVRQLADRYTIRGHGKNTRESYWWEHESESRNPHELFSGEADPLGKIYWFNINGLGAVFFDPARGVWDQQPSAMAIEDDPDFKFGDPKRGISSRRLAGSFPQYMHMVATAATSPDGKIYVIAGLGDPVVPWDKTVRYKLLAAVDVYDPLRNTWRSIAPLHTPRQLHAATFGADGKLYVFGGYAGEGGYESHANDPDDRVKAEAATKAAMTSLASVEMYDPTNDTWTEEAPLSVGKSEPSVGSVGTTIVAADGYTTSQWTGDNEGYNATTNAWTSFAPDPTARNGACAGGIGPQLYVAGGYDSFGSALGLNEALKVSKNKWTTLASMPQASEFAGAAVYKGRVYCIAGWAAFNSTVLNNVQIYQP